jgi:hypothetical protein
MNTFLRINLLFAAISLLMFLTIGCKKSTPTHYDVIPDEVKQWYLYQKGSYWIYQNDKQSENDCTYIIKEPHFWQETVENDDGSIAAIIDHVDTRFEGGVIFGSQIESSDDVMISLPGSSTNIVYALFVHEGQKFLLDQYHVFEYVHHYDSLAFGDHFFKDVRLTRYSYQRSNNVGDSAVITCFYARHIGLIKLTKTISGTDTTWTMIRNNSIQ